MSGSRSFENCQREVLYNAKSADIYANSYGEEQRGAMVSFNSISLVVNIFLFFFIRARNKRPHVETRVVGAVGSRPIPISVQLKFSVCVGYRVGTPTNISFRRISLEFDWIGIAGHE